MYPDFNFPGTPRRISRLVHRALTRAGIGPNDPTRTDWRHALEAIGRYETNYGNPTTGSAVCPGCRGMMQLSVGMYQAARQQGFIRFIRFGSRSQAIYVAILYIRSQLNGFGGYGGIESLLERTDRGPGDVLRYWDSHPRATFEEMRPFYHGY